MTALTNDRNTTRKKGGQAAYPVAANVKIFAGAMVCLDAEGYAVPAADTAGLKFVGVARQYVDNSAGAAGDQMALLWKEGVFDFVTSEATVADVGSPVFVADDQTVNKTTSHGVGCGIITEVESTSQVWVDIAEANRRHCLPQADSTATDVAGIVADFNALLAKLKSARIMA